MNLGSQQACNLSIGQNVTVTGPGKKVLVNPLGSGQKQVLVTPLLPNQEGLMVDKVILKAVSKGTKKNLRAFVLRNIRTASVSTCDDLKSLIRKQLCREITPEDFGVGYMQGSTVVRIRSQEDISEFWSSAIRNPSTKTTLWCDGLNLVTPPAAKKRNHDLIDDNIPDSTPGTKKKKQPSYQEEEVQKIVDSLQEKHGSDFTFMQYRIWGEMVVGGTHKGLDEPPNNTMFSRAGGGTPYKKGSAITQLVTEAATAITAALSPKHTPLVSGLGSSPAKIIEGRSKLYKQLSELQNLRISGVLSEDEYAIEKESIMDLLKKLKANTAS